MLQVSMEPYTLRPSPQHGCVGVVEDVDALPDSRQPRSRVQHLPLQRASPAQRLGLHTHVQACNHITPSVLCVKACRCLVV